MSDSDAKPSSAQERRKSGGRRGGGGDVGNALKAAYDDTLKEDVPADLLALLGKLD